jgi:hypothetical protein
MEKCFMSTVHPSLDVPIVCAEKFVIKAKLDYTKSDANVVKSHVGILMCNVGLHKGQSTYDNLVKSHVCILMCNVDLHKVQSTYDEFRCRSSKVQSSYDKVELWVWQFQCGVGEVQCVQNKV